MVVCHHGFSHNGNFDGRWRPGVQYASPCQILSRSGKPLLKYCNLSISPKWQPSAILDLLDACSDHPRTVLVGLKQSNQLESVQKRAIRIIHQDTRHMSYDNLLYYSNITSLQDRRSQQVEIFHNNFGPNFMLTSSPPTTTWRCCHF